MKSVYDIIKNSGLTYHQKIFKLAMEAESLVNPLQRSNKAKEYLANRIICEMFEGSAPYRPRYTIPDYKKFIKNGSEFLGLKPPADLMSAVNNLLIIYKHIPSITSFPVYIGDLDSILEPFVLNENEKNAYEILKNFFLHIDRTLTDSFVHCNIGPRHTKTANLILKIERELCNATPNLSLKYDNTTGDELALEAVKTGLIASKPYFVNHSLYKKDFPGGYGIASCYNALPLGGGSHTLVRLNLKELALRATTLNTFLKNSIPEAVAVTREIINERIRFLIEESKFYEKNFLVAEGLLTLNKFTAMFGIFGLAESVNILMNSRKKSDRFGNNQEADLAGVNIIETIVKEVNKYSNKYCAATGSKFLLHAQSGIVCDTDVSPGCRIPVTDEPDLISRIRNAGLFHKYFPAGISDNFVFEKTVRQNPESVLDIIKGAMKNKLRSFSFYCSDSDLIRITGFLVKKSEILKSEKGLQTLHDTVPLGLDAYKNKDILNRRIY